MPVRARTVQLLKTSKPVANRAWTNAQPLRGGISLTKLIDMVHHWCVCIRVFVPAHVCVFVCVRMPVHVVVLLRSASRPTEERRKSSTALHHMPNMGLSANLWGILASASKAEFSTEGDE